MDLSTAIPVRDVILRLVAATLIGGVLGLNRELHEKPAGLKTHALLALGTALVTLTGMLLSAEDGRFDSSSVSRVVQGVVAGVGFLGGGAILKDDAGEHISGLTTAASLWLVACLGIACGAGFWLVALAGMSLAVLILVGGKHIENAVHRRAGHGKG